MSLLSASELAYMKGQQALAMPDTCTLRTVSQPDDGSGGWTEGTITDVVNVPCRLMMPSLGRESVLAAQTTPERDYILTIPATYTLTPPMQVLVNAVRFNVISVNDGVSWMSAKRATVRRVE